MGNAQKAWVALFFLVLLAPWWLGFAGFSTPDPLGKSQSTAWPGIGDYLGARSDAAMRNGLRAATDRAPARRAAIHLRSSTALALAKVLAPLPFNVVDRNVVVGQGDWLFWRPHLISDCKALTQNKNLAGLRRFLEDLNGNVPIYLLIGPNKSSIAYGELNPWHQRFLCREGFAGRYRMIRDAVAGSGAKNIALVDPFALAEHLPAAQGEDLYNIDDTHWNMRGKMQAVRGLLAAMNPELSRWIGETEYPDKLPIQGISWFHIFNDRTYDTFDRGLVNEGLAQTTVAGVAVAGMDTYQVHNTFRESSAGLPGRTLFVHDSFFGGRLGFSDSSVFFEDAVFVHKQNGSRIFAALPPSSFDRIVIEINETDFLNEIGNFALPPGGKQAISGIVQAYDLSDANWQSGIFIAAPQARFFLDAATGALFNARPGERLDFAASGTRTITDVETKGAFTEITVDGPPLRPQGDGFPAAIRKMPAK